MKSTLSHMLLSLTGICMALGAILAWMHDLTESPIKQTAQREQQQALAAVLPAGYTNNPLETPDTIRLPGETRPVVVCRASDGDRYCGSAVMSWTADGFAGEIDVMVGFDAEGAVSGYKVLRQAETPGLGAKADEWFRSPEGHRSVIGTADNLAVTKDGGQIDAITAATITSRAFLQAVNRARMALEYSTENSRR